VPEIIDKFESEVAVRQDLSGVKILITAGGTREAIDSVRFIGNRSTGKQGIAIAKAAKARGAAVTLLAANISTENLFGIETISVTNTAQLQSKLSENFPKCDVLIMAAAVSDAKPLERVGKVKKQDLNEISLQPTPDLLAELSKSKKSQVVVGFAAESKENLIAEGQRKLVAKGLDLIYANDIADGGIFGSADTSGFLIAQNHIEEITPRSKESLAGLLLDMVVKRLESPNV
jgi:phosphopantothenoylcysteine decarboxylase/phosphopantothenate--cysteine ligase